MPSSEDYLDDLLSSINQAKADNSGSNRGSNNRRSDRNRRRRSISADDDFLEANGLNDYIPRRMGRENLRKALTEDDFLRDFEDELSDEDSDDFLDDFEKELEMDGLDDASDWDIDEVFGDTGSGRRDTFEEVDDDFGEDLSDDSLDDTASFEDSGDLGGLPQDDLSDAAAGEDLLGGLDAGPVAEPDTAGEPGGDEAAGDDSLMENLENILNDAQDAAGSAASDETATDFGPDELDMSMLNADGSAVEVPLLDESGEGVDLMEALAGDGELVELGDLLSADENAEVLPDAMDAYEASADSILSGVDVLSDASFDEGVEEAGEGGGGIFGKIIGAIKGIFKKKPKGDDIEDLSGSVGDDDRFIELGDTDPTAAELSAESDDILAGFEDAGGLDEAGEEDDEDDKKKKKKEKKERPKDNSPKIPLKVIIGFLLFAVSIIVLVKILQGLYANWLQIGSAQRAYDNGNYLSAYTSLNGVAIKEKDEEDYLLLQRSRLLAPLQMKYREYEVAMENQDYEKALDSLIIGSMYYRENVDASVELEVNEQYNSLGAKIEQQLYDQFGMTEDQAIALVKQTSREDYTVELKHILRDLGMENEASE